MDMMNSGATAYSNHSYYRGDSLSAAGHAAVAANWPNITPTGIPTVFDYYNSAPHDYYHGYPDPIHYNAAANNSTGTPSPHSLENGNSWAQHHHDPFYSQLNGSGVYVPYQQPNKKRGIANSKKERRRTISINGAFSNLRDCIPNVPKDTKLSKIKTLRLACGYIQYLMDTLSSDSNQPIQEFKADLTRKTPCRAEKRKCIEAEIAAAAERKARGRSGWPQTIWAQDLKNDGPATKLSSLSATSDGVTQISNSPNTCTPSTLMTSSDINNSSIASKSPLKEQIDSLSLPSSCSNSTVEDNSDVGGSLS